MKELTPADEFVTLMAQGGVKVDISGLTMSMASGTVNTGLELAVLSKALDAVEDTGQALEQMLEQVVMVPGLGEHIDLRV